MDLSRTIAEELVAFQGTDIVIPDVYTEIASNALQNLGLTSVHIPDSVTSIGNGAFSNNQLTSVIIPNSIESIGVSAFSDNELTSIVIPDSVTSIGSSAFSDNELTSVVIPDSVNSIGSSAFSSNELTSVVIPDSVTELGWAAFFENHLSEISIGSGIKILQEGVFAYNNLKSVEIPDSVEEIWGGPTMLGAFHSNNIAELILGRNISYVSECAFSSCTSVGNPPDHSVNSLEVISVSHFFDEFSWVPDGVEIIRRENSAPIDFLLSNASFDENILGNANVSWVRTIDEYGDAHTYSLVTGDGDTDNSAFTIDGNQLKINESPDYETQESYSVRLRTTDSGGLTFEKAFTLTVNDLEEGPTDLDGDGFVDGITNYQMWTASGGVDLITRRGRTLSDNTSRRWDIAKAIYEDWGGSDYSGGFYLIQEGERRRKGYYRVLAAEDTGVLYWRSDWYSGDQMHSYGYEETFEMDFNGNGVVDVF